MMYIFQLAIIRSWPNISVMYSSLFRNVFSARTTSTTTTFSATTFIHSFPPKCFINKKKLYVSFPYEYEFCATLKGFFSFLHIKSNIEKMNGFSGFGLRPLITASSRLRQSRLESTRLTGGTSFQPPLTPTPASPINTFFITTTFTRHFPQGTASSPPPPSYITSQSSFRSYFFSPSCLPELTFTLQLVSF